MKEAVNLFGMSVAELSAVGTITLTAFISRSFLNWPLMTGQIMIFVLLWEGEFPLLPASFSTINVLSVFIVPMAYLQKPDSSILWVLKSTLCFTTFPKKYLYLISAQLPFIACFKSYVWNWSPFSCWSFDLFGSCPAVSVCLQPLNQSWILPGLPFGNRFI